MAGSGSVAAAPVGMQWRPDVRGTATETLAGAGTAELAGIGGGGKLSTRTHDGERPPPAEGRNGCERQLCWLYAAVCLPMYFYYAVWFRRLEVEMP